MPKPKPPRPRKPARPTESTQSTPKKEPRWVKRFLAQFAAIGNVSLSAQLVGIHRSTPYAEAKDNPTFAAAWEEARETSADVLESEARRRAVEGVERPVFQNGKLVGHVQEYSDTLLIFLLKGERPAKYRETGRVINFNVTPDQLRDMTDDELAQLERKLTAAH